MIYNILFLPKTFITQNAAKRQSVSDDETSSHMMNRNALDNQKRNKYCCADAKI